MQIHVSQSPIKLLSVSHCVLKSLIFLTWFDLPIDLIFFKMREMTEQNSFNSTDFSFRLLFPSFFGQIKYFQLMTSAVLNPEIHVKCKIYKIVIFRSLFELASSNFVRLRRLLLDNFSIVNFFEFVFCL